MLAAIACNSRQRSLTLLAGKKRETELATKPTKATNDDLQMIHKTVGDGVKVELYKDTEFVQEAGGPVDSAEKLSCNMEQPGKCCWENVAAPLDQLQWAQASGSVTPAVFDPKFRQPSRRPAGSYLLVVGSTAASDEAQFSSCSIPCTQGNITVTLR